MIFGLFGKGKQQENLVCIGEVVHYFAKVKAGVIKITNKKVAIGDHIWIKGHTTDFDQNIDSMQVEHEAVESASKGGEVAIKLKKKVRRGDQVFIEKEK